jgi:hypothetical protein
LTYAAMGRPGYDREAEGELSAVDEA